MSFVISRRHVIGRLVRAAAPSVRVGGGLAAILAVAWITYPVQRHRAVSEAIEKGAANLPVNRAKNRNASAAHDCAAEAFLLFHQFFNTQITGFIQVDIAAILQLNQRFGTQALLKVNNLSGLAVVQHDGFAGKLVL